MVASLQASRFLNDQLALKNSVRTLTASDNLLARTLQKQAIPEKREFLQGAKNLVVHAIRDPAGAVREGLARDRAANAIANTVGHTRMQMTGDGLYAVREPIKGLVVNTGGFIGSHLSDALPGQLAGDFAGAYLTRRSIDDSVALGSAIRSSAASPEWASQNPIEKGRDIYRRAHENVLADTQKLGADLYDDTIGWGVGNTVANTVPLPIPLKGGIAAMSYGTEIGQGVKRAILGEPVGTVAQETLQQITSKAPQAWERGWDREEKMKAAINNRLQAVDKEQALALLNAHLSY